MDADERVSAVGMTRPDRSGGRETWTIRLLERTGSLEVGRIEPRPVPVSRGTVGYLHRLGYRSAGGEAWPAAARPTRCGVGQPQMALCLWAQR